MYKRQAAACSKIDKQIKAAETKLEKSLLEKYGELTEDDVKTLVVDDKWMDTVDGKVKEELDSVSHALTSRIAELAELYAISLPSLTERLGEVSKRVSIHLETLQTA